MWVTVLPVDSAKTRIQASRPGDKYDVGLVRAMWMVWLEGGVQASWAGLGPTMVRAFPANAAQWLAWEALLRLLS
jgi:Mitochondrial carrier protein